MVQSQKITQLRNENADLRAKLEVLAAKLNENSSFLAQPQEEEEEDDDDLIDEPPPVKASKVLIIYSFSSFTHVG